MAPSQRTTPKSEQKGGMRGRKLFWVFRSEETVVGKTKRAFGGIFAWNCREGFTFVDGLQGDTIK
jgi:hypothetical protein